MMLTITLKATERTALYSYSTGKLIGTVKNNNRATAAVLDFQMSDDVIVVRASLLGVVIPETCPASFMEAHSLRVKVKVPTTTKEEAQ